jgi:hypothetical protein
MDDIKRQDQIQKIESLIKKQNVSRRDFFGSLGKIAVLSQVVALGAFNFLSSCVAMEDKKDASGKLKLSCDFYECPDPSFACYPTFGCGGNFNCEVDFICPPAKNFQCNPVNYEFNCLQQYTPHSG